MIAKVTVDVSLNREFDYIIPDALIGQLEVGSVVNVPFRNRNVRGYVTGFSDQSSFTNLKPISSVVGQKPMIQENIMRLARWMAEYYACTIEQSLRTVLPGAVRKVDASFKAQKFVHPTALASDLKAITQLRSRAPRQAAMLDVLLQAGDMAASKLIQDAGASADALKSLAEKGFVVTADRTVARDPFANKTFVQTVPPVLMDQQRDALELVIKSIDTHTPPVVLLHGVTGSGKTEIYLQAIDHALHKEMGAIVLVPEISLTPQTVERFRGRFGKNIAVLHSHLSDGERHDEWHRIYDGHARIVVGARSALFAPVRNLGLIVVDEEHEPSYKQDEAPRYNARDVAVMRGHMENCSVLLGSATPSLESYQNARKGKYGLAVMGLRVDHQKMPAMRVVDMRIEQGRGGGGILSRDLKDAISDRLSRAEQVILFLNRRGFSTSLVCSKCGFVAECEQCSIPLTYHRTGERLRCHLCGENRSVPNCCPQCQDPNFKYSGIGTQRVESVVQKLFPRANIHRMDSDTMTRKEAYGEVLGKFRTGKIDILIGTQMIAKGLHFPNVTLVGVISADTSLHMPDFRAGERTFQLLTQVAGRAGRGEIAGEVVVQTFTPFHAAIQAARRLDYEGFFDQEIEFRREFRYPPFGHLVCFTVRGKSEELVKQSIETFAATVKLPGGVMLREPGPAPLAKVMSEYRYQMMITGPTARAMTKPLRVALDQFRWPQGVGFSVDVDALALM